jgi:hypothetical protein
MPNDHLKLGRNNELVFHRTTVDDQAKVIRKANAYDELIITNNCRYKMPEQPKGRRLNYAKAYLGSMSNAEVTALRNDTKQALEDLEDTNRSMAVYQDGDDLLERVRTSCFTVGQQKLLQFPRMRISRWMRDEGFTRVWRSRSCTASRLDFIMQSGWKSWNTAFGPTHQGNEV